MPSDLGRRPSRGRDRRAGWIDSNSLGILKGYFTSVRATEHKTSCCIVASSAIAHSQSNPLGGKVGWSDTWIPVANCRASREIGLSFGNRVLEGPPACLHAGFTTLVHPRQTRIRMLRRLPRRGARADVSAVLLARLHLGHGVMRTASLAGYRQLRNQFGMHPLQVRRHSCVRALL